MNEFELIQPYFQRDALDPSVILDNGDDAAVFSPRLDCETVVSVDSVIAGRHVPDLCPPDGFAARLIGRGSPLYQIKPILLSKGIISIIRNNVILFISLHNIIMN